MEGPARRIGDEAAARYARSVAQVHTSPNRTIPPLSALHETPPAPPPQGIVSIENLKPTNRRNEYVIPPHKSPAKLPHREKVNNNVERNIFEVGQTPTAIVRQPVSTPLPTSPGLKKESALRVDDAQAQPCQDSIICSQCYRCRCQQCSQPRELPRRWICGKWECSAQRAVEVCSCLCCVKGLFYHCWKDDEAGVGASPADDPCAGCGQPYCPLRWTCMGLLSLCLPCLCLYWPLRCALHLCTCCYNKCSRRGCHCRRDKLPGSRRLLIDSESSST